MSRDCPGTFLTALMMSIMQHTAGGTDACDLVSSAAVKALFPGAAACEQQDSADAIFDLSRVLDNVDVRTFAYIYAMRPRDSVCSFSLVSPVIYQNFLKQTHRQFHVAREHLGTKS